MKDQKDYSQDIVEIRSMMERLREKHGFKTREVADDESARMASARQLELWG